MKKKNQNGITLIALVVTIVVLLILAGVSISVVLGDNGLIENAREAKRQTESKSAQELNDIEKLEADVAKQSGAFNNEKGVNEPNLKTGMTPIYFELGSDDIYKEKVTTQDADNWYNYKEKKWANAQTKDGSMWVWIPRFAYKINDDNKTFDVKFLMGTTDYYLDENNIPQKAVRGTADSSPDTRKEYTVHPAFTDETSIGFKNGGWDSELTGIWVAKFEAGFPTSNGNTSPNVKSSIKYTQSVIWTGSVENGSGYDNNLTARNWLDGVYGENVINISFPIFQGAVYSMNNISFGATFAICRVLTEENNIYGLTDDTDSHLMKNSEWGATAYLAQSQYGLNGINVYINNVSFNSGNSSTTKANGNEYASVYGVTGIESSKGADEERIILTNKSQINNRSERENKNIRLWSDKNSGKASTTGNVYGIFDMSGGLCERTTGFIANSFILKEEQNDTILDCIKAYTDKTAEKYKNFSVNNILLKNKYMMQYPFDSTKDIDGGTDSIGESNWQYNKSLKNKIYGDAMMETSIKGTGSNSSDYFFSDSSWFYRGLYPYMLRGKRYDDKNEAGLFAYIRFYGRADYAIGFRAVLV